MGQYNVFDPEHKCCGMVIRKDQLKSLVIIVDSQVLLYYHSCTRKKTLWPKVTKVPKAKKKSVKITMYSNTSTLRGVRSTYLEKYYTVYH